MNRKQRRTQESKMRKELKRRGEILRELQEDNVINTVLDMGCTVLHLDKNEDDTTTLRIFKDE